MALNVRQSQLVAAAQERRQSDSRARAGPAIRQRRIDARQNLHALAKPGDSLHFRVLQPVDLAAGGLMQGFGQQHVVTETVIPVAESFAAISVVAEAAHQVLDVYFRRGDKQRASLGRWNHRQRRSRDARQTNGVPVVGRGEPPHPRLARGDHLRKRREDAAFQFVANQLPRFLAEPVAEPVIGRGEIPGQAGCAQVDLDHLTAKVV